MPMIFGEDGVARKVRHGGLSSLPLGDSPASRRRLPSFARCSSRTGDSPKRRGAWEPSGAADEPEVKPAGRSRRYSPPAATDHPPAHRTCTIRKPSAEEVPGIWSLGAAWHTTAGECCQDRTAIPLGVTAPTGWPCKSDPGALGRQDSDAETGTHRDIRTVPRLVPYRRHRALRHGGDRGRGAIGIILGSTGVLPEKFRLPQPELFDLQ
jgi:hypothetical protein